MIGCTSNTDESCDDPIVLLTKQFSKFLKHVKQENSSQSGKF